MTSKYQSVVIASQALQIAKTGVDNAQSALNRTIADYYATQAAEAKANKLPEGTTFTVDLTKGEVTVVPPKETPKGENNGKR
jgi:hypothetical protein